MHENPGFVSKALSYGVNAYITKTRAADELVLAIRTVFNGNRYLSSDIVQGMQRPEVRLSTRERDVLRALLQENLLYLQYLNMTLPYRQKSCA